MRFFFVSLLILILPKITFGFCGECEFFYKIDTELRNIEKKLYHLDFILCDFEQTLHRKNLFIDEFKNKFAKFENYLNHMFCKKIKYISANYRFYKWLFTLCLRLKRKYNELLEEKERVCCEFNFANLEEKEIWLNEQLNVENCYWDSNDLSRCRLLHSNLGCDVEIKQEYNKNKILILKNQLNHIRLTFKRLDNLSLCIENTLINFKEESLKRQESLEFCYCCCWLV